MQIPLTEMVILFGQIQTHRIGFNNFLQTATKKRLLETHDDDHILGTYLPRTCAYDDKKSAKGPTISEPKYT